MRLPWTRVPLLQMECSSCQALYLLLIMFQRFSIFALLLGALALGSHGAHAKDSAAQSANRKAIAASYNAMDRAFLRRDTNALMSYIAPDYRAHSMNHGVFDRAAYQRVMNLMLAADVRVVSTSTKISKWQWRGPDAVVWVDSKNHLKGPRGHLVAWETTRHYWGKIGGKWMLRQEVTLAYKSLLNGKPLR